MRDARRLNSTFRRFTERLSASAPDACTHVRGADSIHTVSRPGLYYSREPPPPPPDRSPDRRDGKGAKYTCLSTHKFGIFYYQENPWTISS